MASKYIFVCTDNVSIWFICLELVVMKANCLIISTRKMCTGWLLYIKIIDANINEKFKELNKPTVLVYAGTSIIYAILVNVKEVYNLGCVAIDMLTVYKLMADRS